MASKPKKTDASAPDAGAVPTTGARLCHENERAAGTGLARYKIRARDADRPLPRYILAPDRDAAEGLYLAIEKLPEGVELTVTELAD